VNISTTGYQFGNHLIRIVNSVLILFTTNYKLVGPDVENAMKGMSYGWVDTGDGYVSVSGVCPTTSELDDTLKAISAITLVLN